MQSIVSFPSLGIEVTVQRIAFSIFNFPIYWYGVLIACGMAFGLLFVFYAAKDFSLDTDKMTDVIMIGTVGSIICARIYYVVFSPAPYTSFYDAINIRDGGIAIYGAIIGALLFGFFGCKIRGVAVLPMFDVTMMGFFIGQSVGRWGNFVNQEAFGSNTTSAFGMFSSSTSAYLSSVQARLAENGIIVDPNLPVHPTFLYESVFCAIGFLILFFYYKKRAFDGEILLLYIVIYGSGRFFIEGLRTDSLMLYGARVSQLLAAFSVIVAVAVWGYKWKLIKDSRRSPR